MNKKKKVVVCKMDDEGMMGVQAISLVDAPAIMENFVALSKGNKIKLAEVDAERRMVFGPVLIPDLHILRIDEQGEEYYMTFPKETILETSQRYMKMQQQNNATIDHALTVQGCTVVETWIKESETDKSVQLGFTDIPVGSWFVGMKIENDTVWSGIKQGSFNGFSIEGFYNMMSQQFCDSVNYQEAMTELLALEKLLGEQYICIFGETNKQMENNFNSHCPCADLIKSIGGCTCHNMEMRRVNDRSDSYIKFHTHQMNLIYDRNAKQFKTTSK